MVPIRSLGTILQYVPTNNDWSIKLYCIILSCMAFGFMARILGPQMIQKWMSFYRVQKHWNMVSVLLRKSERGEGEGERDSRAAPYADANRSVSFREWSMAIPGFKMEKSRLDLITISIPPTDWLTARCGVVCMRQRRHCRRHKNSGYFDNSEWRRSRVAIYIREYQGILKYFPRDI